VSAADPRPVIVFAGDSVTDCGRRDDPEGLGDGYVRRLAESDALAGTIVLNRGVSGDRSRDLLARWETDVLVAEPSLVSIMIGINDTWRGFDSDDPTGAESYEANLRGMLDTTRTHGISTVLVEPFALPTGVVQPGWREDLEPKLRVVRTLAREYDAAIVPLDSAFREEIGSQRAAAEDLAPDGVHPSPLGHERIASLWLEHATALVASVAARRSAPSDHH
jgi:acyl-CoA thioesterase I